MFGFPISNGNSGYNDFLEKFTNNADSGFPKIQQREIFYSIKDGVWNDATVWQTASGRVGLLPTINDDVYIRHTITNTTLNNVSVNNLFVSGTFTYGNTGYQIFIYGNLKCTGTINHLTASIVLYGSDNYIYNYIFTNGSEAAISYARNDGIPQPIMPLNYWYISMTGSSPKYLVSDLIQNATGSGTGINSSFDTRGYNATFNGPVTFNSTSADFVANGSYLLFKGTLTWSNLRRYDIINSTIEFQNTFAKGTVVNGTFANSIINFTTNTQNFGVNFSGAGPHNIDAIQVNIVGNIELNIAAGSTQLNMYCPFNGTTANSKLTNRADITFRNIESVASMSTGIYDFTTYANTVQYVGNYSATIPSLFTTFSSLTISGTGTKTLSVNTTLNANLLISPNGTLECSTYNLTVTGTTTIGNSFGGANVPVLSKNGSGSLLFIGLVNYIGANASFTGNPTIEYRGGLQVDQGQNSANSYDFGTGNTSFTTNNQTITANRTIDFKGTTTIVGAITVTVANGGDFVRQTGTMNGTVAGSTLNINGRYYINNASSPIPMTTGVFNHLNAATSLIGYVFNGNYTLPYTTYNGLTISGTGTKTIGGNTTMTSLVTIGTMNPTLELSTFDCTIGQISGSFTIFTLSKNGTGNVIFTNSTSTTGNTWVLNFSGNPTVEVRNGLAGFTGASNNYGTGQWTFTTNNQLFDLGGTYNFPILISGAISVTFRSATITSNGVINGNNAASTLILGTNVTFTHRNTTQPMATGVLNTSTNLNTWIYGNGNQDIKGASPKQVYRNLTLNGGGTKTLQGFVGVQNTYTLTFPATLALNGYTLTNP